MHALSSTLVSTTITPKPRKGRFQRLSVIQFIELTGLVAFAQACLAFAQALQGKRFLPAPRRGRPKVYSDLCIFLTSIIQRVWQKSNEGIIQHLYDHPMVAVALLYPVDLNTGKVSIIHPAHYGRRKRQLGLFVYFVAFVALVRRLIRMGIIIGHELILDCSGLRAWYHHDPDARWNGFLKIFGYKIHLIMDGSSMLPIMLLITPANVHESVVGVILLLAVWFFYNLTVSIVRADAAYFDRKTVWIIRFLFGAKAYVDYNLRRRGKKFLATLPFIWWWKEQLAKRGAIERLFAILKRWYGLKYFQVRGLANVTRYALLTCMAMLLTAQAAQAINRPELMRSPKRLLAL